MIFSIFTTTTKKRKQNPLMILHRRQVIKGKPLPHWKGVKQNGTKQARVATSEVIRSHCLALPLSLQLMCGASERGAKSPWAEQAVALHDAVQMSSCPRRKQALFWDSYHESHKPAPVQVLSRVTLESIPSAALNVMLPKWKGRRRAGTNTSKPFACVAHWR